jgi:5-methylcytosine-specific restriction endonuclease McrA
VPASNVKLGVHRFRAMHAQRARLHGVKCLYCNVWFSTHYPTRTSYCKTCRPKRAVHRATKHDTPLKKVVRENRRRARKMATETSVFSYQDVINKHGLQCHVCNEEVNLDLKYPHSQSKSLDHVIPLSKGGGHVLSNVKVTHLSCNIRKGNRT